MAEGTKEFTPITTQEAFNEAVQDRLGRQSAKHAEEINQLKSQYSDYEGLKAFSEEWKDKIPSIQEELEKLKNSNSEYDQKLKDKDAKIAEYSKAAARVNVAIETGLPMELANRITGDNEEDMKKDALKLLKVVAPRSTAPIANTETGEGDGVMAAFKKLNPNIKF